MISRNIPRISSVQFSLWRNDPVTLTVFEFLKAYREKVRAEHVERWEQGQLDEQLENRAVGVIIFVNTFLQLEYDAILAAYETDEITEDE